MPLSPHPGFLDLTAGTSELDLVAEYTALADRWVHAGLLHHTALLGAGDSLAETLADLGFGREQTYATRKTARIPVADYVRPARESDLDQVLPLTPLIAATNLVSPVFAILPDGFLDQFMDAHRREFTSEHSTYLVAELEEKVVGFAIINHTAAHPLWPNPTAELTVAVVAPEHRGKGIGIALALGAINWAFEAGHRDISTDWRSANATAARAWKRAGFEVTGWRMSRVIQPATALLTQ